MPVAIVDASSRARFSWLYVSEVIDRARRSSGPHHRRNRPISHQHRRLVSGLAFQVTGLIQGLDPACGNVRESRHHHWAWLTHDSDRIARDGDLLQEFCTTPVRTIKVTKCDGLRHCRRLPASLSGTRLAYPCHTTAHEAQVTCSIRLNRQSR